MVASKKKVVKRTADSKLKTTMWKVLRPAEERSNASSEELRDRIVELKKTNDWLSCRIEVLEARCARKNAVLRDLVNEIDTAKNI